MGVVLPRASCPWNLVFEVGRYEVHGVQLNPLNGSHMYIMWLLQMYCININVNIAVRVWVMARIKKRTDLCCAWK